MQDKGVSRLPASANARKDGLNVGSVRKLESHPGGSALTAALGIAALAFLMLIKTAAAQGAAIVWVPPTQADRHQFTATTGKQLNFSLVASTSNREARVRIEPVGGLPAGAALRSSHGRTARSTFHWRPLETGDYSISFVARDDGGAPAPVRTYLIRVNPTYPRSVRLTNAKVGRWATVEKPTVVRSQPTRSARMITTLETITPDSTQNIVLILESRETSPSETWYRVRLPILPNNTTGWVQRHALGELRTVHTHLYIDRARFTATLKRDGVTIFTTRIGVGKPYWPTPPGQYYVRDKLTGFGVPLYGPIAFGTNARSAVLTDWPGGGFIGIHGTNEPELLPGRVSHGCIRMKNESILKLARLMRVGSPITIR